MLESDTRSKRVIAAGRITPGFTCTHHRATIGLNGECLLCGRTPQATIWKCPSGGALFGLVAAWPGEHRPTEADLELPVRARVMAFTPMQAEVSA